jgi:GT2 family glycosyltransferase
MPSPVPIVEIVSATRRTADAFTASPLGVSLARMARDPRLVPHIAFENSRPLPEIYNERIASPDAADALVFIHDDVWIEDYFFVDRLLEALNRFDIVGLAGNSRRVPGQRTWINSPHARGPDHPYLRGAVAHGDGPMATVRFFGPNAAECELLDGVLLATRKATLVDRGVAFDPQFSFHFYDLDFCRTARAAGLRLGVWPIAVTHGSGGAFRSPEFKENGLRYFAKWGD